MWSIRSSAFINNATSMRTILDNQYICNPNKKTIIIWVYLEDPIFQQGSKRDHVINFFSIVIISHYWRQICKKTCVNACVDAIRQQMVIHLRSFCLPRWWCSYAGFTSPYAQPMAHSALPNRAACNDKQLSKRQNSGWFLLAGPLLMC